MIISNIRVKNEGNKSKMIANIKCNEIEDEIWYEVNKEDADYLCYERADSFLIALLLFAMEKGEDIKILDTPISSKLYYNLNFYLIPALVKNSKKYKQINIFCDTESKSLKSQQLSGSGISCGIDSFMTISENLASNCPSEFKVDCLTFFNVGSHGDFGGDKARKLYEMRKNNSQQFAKEQNFKFIEVDSNISDFIKMEFLATHTYRNCSAVLAIQKLFKNYYYSSGISVVSFEMSDKDPAKYDTFLLNMLSNENITFYSSGTPYNRNEKTEKVTCYEPSYDYLNVCVKEGNNCGMCEKCVRTLLTLNAMNKLNLYNKVFNIKKFNKKIDKHYRFMLRKVYVGNEVYSDIYNLYKKNKIKIGILNKFIAFFVNTEVVRKLMPETFKIKLKKILRRSKDYE